MLVKFVKRVTILSFIWGYLQFRLRRSLKIKRSMALVLQSKSIASIVSLKPREIMQLIVV
mgnify:CR=1 FL=1